MIEREVLDNSCISRLYCFFQARKRERDEALSTSAICGLKETVSTQTLNLREMQTKIKQLEAEVKRRDGLVETNQQQRIQIENLTDKLEQLLFRKEGAFEPETRVQIPAGAPYPAW